jgi:hypothetical protein
MKKILSILIALLLISAGAYAEEGATPSPAPTEEMEDAAGAVYSLYDFKGETMDATAPYWVAFDELFKMQMPAGWQNYALTDSQSENGMIACFGDGTHFMFVGREEDTGAYADMNELGMTLALNENYVSIYLETFNETEFLCYADYENKSSDCAILIPGKGVYTFYFYPVDGDTDFAHTVMDLMNSYASLDAENGDE